MGLNESAIKDKAAHIQSPIIRSPRVIRIPPIGHLVGERGRAGQSFVELAIALPVILLAMYGVFMFALTIARISVSELAASAICEYYASNLPISPAQAFHASVDVSAPFLPSVRIAPPSGILSSGYIVDLFTGDASETLESQIVYSVTDDGWLRLSYAIGYPPDPSRKKIIRCSALFTIVDFRLPFYRRVLIQRWIRYTTVSRWGG